LKGQPSGRWRGLSDVFGREETQSHYELLILNVGKSEIAGLGDIEEFSEVGGSLGYNYGNVHA